MKPPILLAGYHGHDAATLKQRADELNALVVDARLKPYSWDKQWNRQEIESTLSLRRYFWLGLQWGNLNFKGDFEGQGIMIADFKAGAKELANKLKQRASASPSITYDCVILLCVCPCQDTCHRAELGKMLKERYGFDVYSLDWQDGIE